MSDVFSADQLSAASPDGTSAGPGFEDSAAGTGVDYAALKQTLGRFAECTQSVLATVLNRSNTVEIDACAKSEPDRMSQVSQEDALAIRIPLSGGVSGDLMIVMAKKEVALLSDLMMLGDGSAAYSDEHKDAISELASQIMGAFISGINGDGLQPPASTGGITVAECGSAGLEAFSGDSAVAMMKIDIDGIGNDHVAVLVPDSVSLPLMALAASDPANPKRRAGADQSVGLSAQELNDLADASTFDTAESGGFTETAFGTSKASAGKSENIEMLMDVDLDVSIELGRASLSIKRILELAPGSIVELDRMAGEPVDLMVNKTVVAKGEVVVVDENFGIRIVSLVSPEERIRSLK